MIIYCLLLGTYGKERYRPRNGPAATARGGCNDASIPRDPAGRPPEPRPRYLSLHIRPVGIRSRFADRRLSVFVIEGALPQRGRHKFLPRPAAARGTMRNGSTLSKTRNGLDRGCRSPIKRSFNLYLLAARGPAGFTSCSILMSSPDNASTMDRADLPLNGA